MSVLGTKRFLKKSQNAIEIQYLLPEKKTKTKNLQVKK